MNNDFKDNIKNNTEECWHLLTCLKNNYLNMINTGNLDVSPMFQYELFNSINASILKFQINILKNAKDLHCKNDNELMNIALQDVIEFYNTTFVKSNYN